MAHAMFQSSILLKHGSSRCHLLLQPTRCRHPLFFSNVVAFAVLLFKSQVKTRLFNIKNHTFGNIFAKTNSWFVDWQYNITQRWWSPLGSSQNCLYLLFLPISHHHPFSQYLIFKEHKITPSIQARFVGCLYYKAIFLNLQLLSCCSAKQYRNIVLKLLLFNTRLYIIFYKLTCAKKWLNLYKILIYSILELFKIH